MRHKDPVNGPPVREAQDSLKMLVVDRPGIKHSQAAIANDIRVGARARHGPRVAPQNAVHWHCASTGNMWQSCDHFRHLPHSHWTGLQATMRRMIARLRRSEK
jgi:hypothetical protein